MPEFGHLLDKLKEIPNIYMGARRQRLTVPIETPQPVVNPLGLEPWEQRVYEHVNVSVSDLTPETLARTDKIIALAATDFDTAIQEADRFVGKPDPSKRTAREILDEWKRLSSS